MNLENRYEQAKAQLQLVQSDEYRTSLIGTIGADPILQTQGAELAHGS